MRVCLVSGGYPPAVSGGAENYVRRTGRALAARGHEVSVLTTRPYDGPRSLLPRRRRDGPLTIYEFFPANVAHRSTYGERSLPAQAAWRALDAGNPHAALTVARVVDRERPNVVHTNNLEGISTLAARACRRSGARHVHTLHDYNLVCPNSSPRAPGLPAANDSIGNHPLATAGFARLQRALFGTPDFVTGPSRYVIDVHLAHGFFGGGAERRSAARGSASRGVSCRRIPLGASTVVETVPEPLGPAEPPRLLFVGRLERLKGVDTLLDAASRRPALEVDVCGTGPRREAIERRAARLDNATYHGFVSDGRLAELRREASLAVVPSEWLENSPLAVYESFAAGLPVVASAVGGLPELVAPGETGALFRPGDPTDLLRAVDDALAGDLAGMRRAALAWAREHTEERHVDRLLTEAYARA